MPLPDIGYPDYFETLAAATADFSPLSDRAANVTRILLQNASAEDVWRVKVGGTDVAAFDVNDQGHQQPLANAFGASEQNNDFFTVIAQLIQQKISFPVPQGMTMHIASDGGATADICIQFEEVAPSDLSPGMPNHPRGSRWILPIVGYRSAVVTAVGEQAFDTIVAPDWWPNLFVDGKLPSNWDVRVLCMFLEGAGVNTYNSSSDDLSQTTYLGVQKNQTRMFTRELLGGIPLVGTPAATGSANIVPGNLQTPYPAFQEVTDFSYYAALNQLRFAPGDSWRLRLNVDGAVSANADYSDARQLLIVDARTPG